MTQRDNSQICGITIVDIAQPDDNEEYLLGTCTILGVLHHAEFVRVEMRDGEQVAVCDPHGRFDGMQQYYEGRYQTVQVSGFEGEWAVVIFPYC